MYYKFLLGSPILLLFLQPVRELLWYLIGGICLSFSEEFKKSEDLKKLNHKKESKKEYYDALISASFAIKKKEKASSEIKRIEKSPSDSKEYEQELNIATKIFHIENEFYIEALRRVEKLEENF